MVDSDEFKTELVENLPHLRAFAHLIARNHALAEDLVQDTIVRALANRHQFKPGTNLKGWLIIILRNRFFNEMRRSSRKSEVSVEHMDNLVAIDGGQQVTVEIRDFNRAFRQLPATQREALVLVGASGFSYEEAAEIAHCPVGTMKSRVSRARAELDGQLRGVERPGVWADRMPIPDKAGQDKAGQDKTGQDKAGQEKAGPDEVRRQEADEWRPARRVSR